MAGEHNAIARIWQVFDPLTTFGYMENPDRPGWSRVPGARSVRRDRYGTGQFKAVRAGREALLPSGVVGPHIQFGHGQVA